MAVLFALPGLLEWVGILAGYGFYVWVTSLSAVPSAIGLVVLRKVAGLPWSWLGLAAIACALASGANIYAQGQHDWRPSIISPALWSYEIGLVWGVITFALWAGGPLLVVVDAALIRRSCRRLRRS
ncbi:MAG: hypothetical protein AAGA57_03570 [Planctomycetota bacterium]